jgi:hypothetical protein
MHYALLTLTMHCIMHYRYTTIAKLAGLDDASTGPVASDGVDMWSAIVR